MIPQPHANTDAALDDAINAAAYEQLLLIVSSSSDGALHLLRSRLGISARLHHAVRRLREANGTRARVLQPEALAAELGMPTRCVDMWWRDPRCEAEGAHAETRPSS